MKKENKRTSLKEPLHALRQAYGDVLMQHLQLKRPIKIWKNNRLVDVSPMKIIRSMSPKQRRECGLANLKKYQPPKYHFL